MTIAESTSVIEELISKAEENGTSKGLFFSNTLQQYNSLLKLQEQCLREIDEKGELILIGDKVVVNPALKVYQQLCKTALTTVNTLGRIVKQGLDNLEENPEDEEL